MSGYFGHDDVILTYRATAESRYGFAARCRAAMARKYYFAGLLLGARARRSPLIILPSVLRNASVMLPFYHAQRHG